MESLIRCPDSDRTLQFDTEKKSWFVTVQGHCYLISDESDQSALAVLPFLELPLDDVAKRVSELLVEHPDLRFPYEFFVLAGFKHGSPHWTDCSLRWLSGLDWLDADFTKDLEKVVCSKKRYSQKSRHLAKKLIKRQTSNYSPSAESGST